MATVLILLCLWHVKRSWLKNLMTKVATWLVRKALFGHLSFIMEQSKSEADAVAQLEKFFEKWSEEEPAFAAYVKKEWAGKLGMLQVNDRNCHF